MNFARFENVIDPVDECVELVLEIEEASQARKVTMSSSAAASCGSSMVLDAQVASPCRWKTPRLS